MFDLVHIELQSLSPGLKTTSSTYIKASLSVLPRTWKTPFSKKQIHLVSRVSKRSGQIAFFFSFPPPYLFPCSVSVLREANYTQGSWEQHPKRLFMVEWRKSRPSLSSRNSDEQNSLCLHAGTNELFNRAQERQCHSQTHIAENIIFLLPQ